MLTLTLRHSIVFVTLEYNFSSEDRLTGVKLMKPVTQDLHVHSSLSKCGSVEATVENMLKAAEKQGLKTIGFSDHCWAKELPGVSSWYSGQDIDHVQKIREGIPADVKGVNILVGCETEYIGGGISGMNRELSQCFDFVWLPANHFHQKGFVVPEDLGAGGPAAVSELLYRRFMEAVNLGFGNGIVHPFVPMGFLEWEADILNGISHAMYENCFRSASQANLSIEIHTHAVTCDTCIASNGFSSIYLAIYTIARECGCKFTFGTDAHHPDRLSGYERMGKFAESCGINREFYAYP